jgi:hypothetical protein
MAGVPAQHADDVELHYAANNKEWTSKHVKEVRWREAPLFV